MKMARSEPSGLCHNWTVTSFSPIPVITTITLCPAARSILGTLQRAASGGGGPFSSSQDAAGLRSTDNPGPSSPYLQPLYGRCIPCSGYADRTLRRSSGRKKSPKPLQNKAAVISIIQGTALFLFKRPQ